MSCNIEAECLNTRGRYNQSEDAIMPLPEFTRRLCLAVAQTRIGGALHPFILEEFPDQRASRLPLWRFGAWAAAQGWTLPDDFPRVMPPERAAPQAAPAHAASKPWLAIDPSDPKAQQSWYTPARYFARQFVIKDSSLILKKFLLADQVSKSLADVGIFKRGGKKPPAATTVRKAFSNVSLG